MKTNGSGTVNYTLPSNYMLVSLCLWVDTTCEDKIHCMQMVVKATS